MKQEEGEVIFKFKVVPTVPFPSAVNWDIEATGVLIRCKDCIHNVANRQTDPLDTADYSGIDIVCDYFMTDGQETDDYCSHAERKEEWTK